MNSGVRLKFFDFLPKKPRRKLMHVSDAGDGLIQFRCHRCGHDTGWIEDTKTVTENKRGIPCPKCNA